jgi:phage-related protein
VQHGRTDIRPPGARALKDVEWIGSSYRDLVATDENVKDSVGYALERAQAGEMAGYAEPMKGKFRDIIEIRTPDETGDSTYRAAYTTKIGDVVYFLDIFKKKSKKGTEIPQRDLGRIAKRYQTAQEHYEKHHREK